MKWTELDPVLKRVESRGGDGWEQLLSLMRPRLLAVLKIRRIELELAEDVVQESLVIIWRRWHTLRQRDRLDAWATSILLNRLRTHLIRRRKVAEIPHNAVTDSGDALEELVRNEGVAWVFRAVAALPERQRDPVELRLVSGLSPESTCRALGITRPCLRRRLHEGIKRLRRRARSPSGQRAARAMGIGVARPTVASST